MTKTIKINLNDIQEQSPVVQEINSHNNVNSKKENKYYLPILYINDPNLWPSKPISERKHFTDKIAEETCLSNCCGISGVGSICCKMDPENLEHVLGPLDEEWIKDILKYFRARGLNYTRTDVVIDFEEGKIIGENLFNGHKVFMSEDSYPILRFQVNGPRYSCKFLNPNSGKCLIYENRPTMCRGYLCEYVKSNFLVRTVNHINTYKKLR